MGEIDKIRSTAPRLHELGETAPIVWPWLLASGNLRRLKWNVKMLTYHRAEVSAEG